MRWVVMIGRWIVVDTGTGWGTDGCRSDDGLVRPSAQAGTGAPSKALLGQLVVETGGQAAGFHRRRGDD